jgi:hypothetical protein
MKRIFYPLFLCFSILTIACSSESNKQSSNASEATQEELNQENGYSALEQEVKTDLNNYLEAFNKKQWEQVLDMLYPRLFELISKEDMVRSYTQLEEMGMNIQSSLKAINKVSAPVEEAGDQFWRVYYNAEIRIHLGEKMLINQETFQNRFMDLYGTSNVKFYEESSTFVIDAKKSMLAIQQKGSSSKKYLEYNEDQMETLNDIVPPVVLEQLAL